MAVVSSEILYIVGRGTSTLDSPLTRTALLRPRESAVLSFIFSTRRCFTFFMAVCVCVYVATCVYCKLERNTHTHTESYPTSIPMSIFFPLGGSILLKAIVISPYKETCIDNNYHHPQFTVLYSPCAPTLDKSPPQYQCSY